MLIAFLAREFILVSRRSHQFVVLFCFYALCSFIFLAVDPTITGWIFLITICPVLALLLSFPHIFEQDEKDGVLQDITMTRVLWRPLLVSKIILLWTVLGFPQILWFGILHLVLPAPISLPLGLGVMLCNALNLSLLMTMIAALCLRTKAQGGLVFLLLLPLYSPSLFYLIRALAENHTNAWQGLLALTLINAILAAWFTPRILKEALRHDA
jgi:heme exporter protein CcmB